MIQGEKMRYSRSTF